MDGIPRTPSEVEEFRRRVHDAIMRAGHPMRLAEIAEALGINSPYLRPCLVAWCFELPIHW
jgi:hypothetical protein